MARVLIVNSGSSSLKLSVIEDDNTVKIKKNFALNDSVSIKNQIQSFLTEAGNIDIVAHRIVHGGSKYRKSVIIDEDVRSGLEALSELAPLHNPVALKIIDIIIPLLPSVPEVACFDTAFHSTLPYKAFTYAIPKKISDAYDIRRFGFHGLSCSWSTKIAKQVLPYEKYKKLIICHLGAGASLTAVADGKSVDTTMGFTPLEGVVMATRSGDIDPGIIIYLLRHAYGINEIEEILDKQSGLSSLLEGSKGNMLYVLDLFAKDDPEAKEAIEIYTTAVAKKIAAMSISLDGLSSLVFTGGIGEGSYVIRKEIAKKIRFLGLSLDDEQNKSYDGSESMLISKVDSDISALVVTAQEDLIMAEEARGFLK